jgi:hypothetical protein
VNFFQPSFKLKEKRREGAKVIKRYHEPSTPYERALAHPMVAEAVKERLRAQYRTLDPVARRDPRGAGGARQSHRPSYRRRAPRERSWKERYGRTQLDGGTRRVRPRAWQ